MPSLTLRDISDAMHQALRARATEHGWSLRATVLDLLERGLTRDAHARDAGKAGGRARAAALSPSRRSAIATKAAQARWREE